jgi:hypothetical protein
VALGAAVPICAAAGLLVGWPSAARAPGAEVVVPHVRIIGAAPYDLAGFSLANAGDVNGDGRPDLVIGAPGTAGPPGEYAGAAYVVFGQAGATTIDLANLGVQGFRIAGAPRGSATGWAVAGAGDLNRDGLADVIVGAPGVHEDVVPPPPRGAAYVVYGKRDAAPVDLSTLNGGFRILGRRHRWPDKFGSSVAGLGDFNGDGRPDVAVGAPGNPGFEEQFTRGSAVVVYGRRRPPSTVSVRRLGRAGFRIKAWKISAVAGLGDVNGDRRPDMGIGDTGAYAAYVVYGRNQRRALSRSSLGGNGFKIHRGRREFGAPLTGAGDVNRDGLADVLVGRGTGIRGGAFVVFGTRAPRRIDLLRPGRAALTILPVAGNTTGSAVAGAGDVDADGHADVLVTTSSSVLVLLGRRSRAPVPMAEGRHGVRLDPAAYATNPEGRGPGAVAGAGDWNLDGRDDVAVAAAAAAGAGRELAGVVTVITSQW